MSATRCTCVWYADYSDRAVPDPECTHPGHADGSVATLDIPASV